MVVSPGIFTAISTALGATRSPTGHRRFTPLRLLAISFLALITLGTALLVLPAAQRNTPVGWLDCLFTATSAATVTGLVTQSTAESWTLFGQLVILVLIQIGGLGYMTLATVIAMRIGLRVGLQQHLRLSDARGVFSLRDILRVARYIVLATLGVEAVGALLLTLRFHYAHGADWATALYHGCFYSVSAFCNAGFDLSARFTSLQAPIYREDLWLLVILGVLIILGGLGFGVLAEVVTLRRARRVSLHCTLVLLATLALMLLGWGHMLLFEGQNPLTLGGMTTPQRITNAWFMAVTPRTAGFTTVDMTRVTPPTLFVTGLLMIVGASPDSTGGGVKTTTLVIILLAMVTLMRRRSDIEFFGRRIPGELVRLALSLVSVYLVAILVLVLGISITEGVHPGNGPLTEHTLTRFVHLLFELLSALGTGGLSTSITPTLTTASRVLLVVAMLLGRLGPLTFVYVVARPKRRQLRRLPTETVMAG